MNPDPPGLVTNVEVCCCVETFENPEPMSGRFWRVSSTSGSLAASVGGPGMPLPLPAVRGVGAAVMRLLKPSAGTTRMLLFGVTLAMKSVCVAVSGKEMNTRFEVASVPVPSAW